MPYTIMKGIKRNPDDIKPVELVNVGTEESPQWALLITGEIDVDINMASEGIAKDATLTGGSQKSKWVDDVGNVLGGTTPAKVSVEEYDMLKADITSATSDTNVVTVTQAGIKSFRLSNPSSTITMYVNFGADPAAASQIVLPPLTSYDDTLKTVKGDMRYKSSAAGGTLVYVLKG